MKITLAPLGAALPLALALSLSACASNERKAQAPPDRSVPAHGDTASSAPRQATDQKGDTASPTTGSIHIDERIVKACGSLPIPHFPFDSAAIRDQAADKLQIVAKCFVEGPLKGRSVKLVGRADPRGSEAYNLTLGQDRASSVARFLESMGVSASHVTTMSRGDFDATGTDEEGWAKDRRVDLLLAD